uniref:Uncharacterized protein n=1 Tax=Buteo japonicus TaxID=224669 RepID=A0A8B9ZCY8_9AVES
MTLVCLGWCNTSSRPQLLYTAIVMSIQFIPLQIAYWSTAYQTWLSQYQMNTIMPNYKLASCGTWPITDLRTPLPRTPSTITSNQTGPDTTFLTTKQLKKKLQNQHTSLHAIINLNTLMDLCKHSKLHQNNLYALTGFYPKCTPTSSVGSQIPMFSMGYVMFQLFLN